MQRLIFLALVCHLHAAEVHQVTWPTTHASPAVKLGGHADAMLPGFRAAMASVPGATIVSLALMQPAMIGLNEAHAQTLRPLAAARYELIAASAVYKAAPSALPYCLSEKKPTHGLANVHVPDGASAKSRVLLFLHGYGGSFLWYQHWLSTQFPDHIIICPAYGISPSNMPLEYALECLTAVEKRLGWPLTKPWLLGLSAGGFGVCQLYVAAPGKFTGMICIAAYPHAATQSRFPAASLPCFIAGGEEMFVKSGEFTRSLARVKQKTVGLRSYLVPGADHFFLLTHEQPTVTKLREWLASSN